MVNTFASLQEILESIQAAEINLATQIDYLESLQDREAADLNLLSSEYSGLSGDCIENLRPNARRAALWLRRRFETSTPSEE